MAYDKDSLYEDIPISDYYKGNIKDAITIKRSGNWWSAVLLIKNPRVDSDFLSFYQWQKTDSGWKVRSRFKIKNIKEKDKIIEILKELGEKLSN